MKGTNMETINTNLRFGTVAGAIEWAQVNEWTVFTRGAKKATAARIVGSGKKAVIEQMFLAGGEGDRYWALMRQA